MLRELKRTFSIWLLDGLLLLGFLLLSAMRISEIINKLERDYGSYTNYDYRLQRSDP